MRKWEILAVKSITNMTGIQVVYIDDNIIKFRKVTTEKAYKVNNSHIRYDKNGNPYFIAWGYREYLSEYKRCK